MAQALDRFIPLPRRWKGAGLLCVSLVTLAFGARWMISAPLGAAGSLASWPADRAEAGPEALEDPAVDWPEAPLEGPEAKRRLLRAVRDLVERLESLRGYEAIVRRHERVGGRWLAEQTLRMKVRHRPASVYMKDIGVAEGCEIIHVEGLRGGKLISHPGGGLLGLLLPPVELDPRSPLAMSQSRFPITEAGVLPVARMVLMDAERDLDDPAAAVVLDRVVEGGRTYYRSIQRYDQPTDGRQFARVEVQYEPETLVPRAYAFYDWPDAPGSEPAIAGRYVIESFDPGAAPGDLDFDPTNPEYKFR